MVEGKNRTRSKKSRCVGKKRCEPCGNSNTKQCSPVQGELRCLWKRGSAPKDELSHKIAQCNATPTTTRTPLAYGKKNRGSCSKLQEKMDNLLVNFRNIKGICRKDGGKFCPEKCKPFNSLKQVTSLTTLSSKTPTKTPTTPTTPTTKKMYPCTTESWKQCNETECTKDTKNDVKRRRGPGYNAKKDFKMFRKCRPKKGGRRKTRRKSRGKKRVKKRRKSRKKTRTKARRKTRRKSKLR